MQAKLIHREDKEFWQRKDHSKHKPHQSRREKLRRQKQLMQGQIKQR